MPQNSHDQQDCKTAAAKRWLAQQGPRLIALNFAILGDLLKRG